MLIIDDILLSPARSMAWIFRQIHDAAQQELSTEGERITCELRELYMMLETGKITEAEFETHEKELLDKLDEMQGGESRLHDEDEDEEDLESVDAVKEIA